MNNTKIKELIQDFVKLTKQTEEQVKKYCQDVSFPLEERWGVFIMSPFGNRGGYLEHFDNLDDDIIYGERDYDRNQQIYIVDNINDGDYDQFLTNEQKNGLKEEVLKKWIKSYDFDW